MATKRRTIRPEYDREVFKVLHAIRHMTAEEVSLATYEAAKKSKWLSSVSAQTITNWRKGPKFGGVRYPQHHCLEAVARVAGFTYVMTPIEEVRQTKARVGLLRQVEREAMQ